MDHAGEDGRYRNVEEELTNALRYAAKPSASVEVARRSDWLRITPPNPVSTIGRTGRGRGLRGMEERVPALGGVKANADSGGTRRLTAECHYLEQWPHDSGCNRRRRAAGRGGSRAVADPEPAVRGVGGAEDGVAVVGAVRRRRPEVVLKDVRMPGR